jgi:hypothetical protein
MRHRDPTLLEHIAALLPVNKPAGRRRATYPNHAGITLKEKPMSAFLLLIRSRKFWASIAGLLLVTVQAFVPDFPLDAEQVTNVIYVIVAFIIGSGLEDARPVG